MLLDAVCDCRIPLMGDGRLCCRAWRIARRRGTAEAKPAIAHRQITLFRKPTGLRGMKTEPMVGHMSPDLTAQVIVLNGASSSGKSTIAKALQDLLPDLWLTFGVDAFIDALPGRGDSPRADITYRPNGAVETGPQFRAREGAWRVGLAAMARGGAPLILDEVFLSGGATQTTMRATLQGLHVLWVGVHCDLAVAAAREAQRRDRIPGMARTQAKQVHTDMSYDIEVDTTDMSPEACARVIAVHVISPSSWPSGAQGSACETQRPHQQPLGVATISAHRDSQKTRPR